MPRNRPKSQDGAAAFQRIARSEIREYFLELCGFIARALPRADDGETPIFLLYLFDKTIVHAFSNGRIEELEKVLEKGNREGERWLYPSAQS